RALVTALERRIERRDLLRRELVLDLLLGAVEDSARVDNAEESLGCEPPADEGPPAGRSDAERLRHRVEVVLPDEEREDSASGFDVRRAETVETDADAALLRLPENVHLRIDPVPPTLRLAPRAERAVSTRWVREHRDPEV